ncbi:DEAD/DEAH box helicase [Agromyces atrinae]|uniref:DEAD/DEAH box helicase n=1 Tax=Agromyces atrinae TaxID=592376 RepID=A0A4Q2M3D7_9MICO|nr:DEAD/DEAH box helicase [Agromyces atrinae]MCI2958627.1 DEAD/DEAH box helicase [Agromyces atrinae]NYD66154.1 superfamily II DNA or RNA helicase [Agromyces atrinae]RXZ86494.1 DEAD/DEAH box helicase [Agromyces atrinae]
MSTAIPSGHVPGTSAAEHLPPSYPERAAWGTAGKLRAWQAEAIDAYLAASPRDFLAAATPGAGKTTFALRLASELRHRREIDRITVVAPTEHLKKQWADAAARAGIRLDPTFRNAHGRYGRHFHGVVVTYAQVATRPALHRELTQSGRSLVILDEVHHGGDALSWGDAIREAFEPATRRLSLSGTPFRSDTAPIPFVEYAPDERGIRLSRTDYNYGYGRALADGVVRPVMFMVYAGHMRWRTRAGDEMEAKLGEDNTKDITSAAWRTALEPTGEWIPAVLRAADRRLSEVRQAIPDAGGLVIATDQSTARAYAQILHEISGEPVTIVLSDEKEASDRIEQFSESERRWMVAVRMVSEGVDVPRLAVGVYATSASTPLFFAQAIGRFVRARRRGETASVFLPNVPGLMALANQMELERDHALDKVPDDDAEGDLYNPEDALVAEANREDKASEELTHEFTWEALGSTAAFDRVVYDGTDFGTLAEPGSDEELDFIGLPGILEPEQVSELLRHRQARQARRATERTKNAPPATDDTPVALYRTLKEQRTLLNSLVGMWSKLSGEAHGIIHAELRRVCGGPAVAQASVTQLQARIDHLRKRLSSH